MNNTMDLIEKINIARVDERSTLLKSLNRVFKTLEADSTLKATMQAMAETNTTTFGNVTNLIELLRNSKLPEILTKLNGFQASLNSLSSQCASILESLKEDPEFNQILLKAVEGYIQNSTRLTKISRSLKEINFPSSAAISTVTPPEANATVGRENFRKQVVIWHKPPFYTKGKPQPMVIGEPVPEPKVAKGAEVEKDHIQEP
ncbi:hypothetical protein Tco_0784971 [Tanacetum coccineum]